MTKILSTDDLLFLAREADRSERNRRLNVEYLEPLLDPEGTHVISWTMVHNDCEIRARILMKLRGDDQPHEGWLDMSFEHFNRLEDHEATEAACKGTHTYSGLHDYEDRDDGSRVCRACGKVGLWPGEVSK